MLTRSCAIPFRAIALPDSASLQHPCNDAPPSGPSLQRVWLVIAMGDKGSSLFPRCTRSLYFGAPPICAASNQLETFQQQSCTPLWGGKGGREKREEQKRKGRKRKEKGGREKKKGKEKKKRKAKTETPLRYFKEGWVYVYCISLRIYSCREGKPAWARGWQRPVRFGPLQLCPDRAKRAQCSKQAGASVIARMRRVDLLPELPGSLLALTHGSKNHND